MQRSYLPSVATAKGSHLKRLGAVTVVLGAIVACSASRVTLGDVTYPGSAVIRPHPPAAAMPNGACPGSVVTAASGPDIYGAWWEVRDDSSAILMVGRSTDRGRSWSIVQAADTSDHSLSGCSRPSPAIAADSSTNYVDIAYFMQAKEGPGVFFTHSMDARTIGSGDGIFHSPVAVEYGDKPAHVAVAAHGDQLAVAYEGPNGEQSVIGLALSRTMGHIFEQRIVVSQPDLPAVDPLVVMRGDSVMVQWAERPDTVQTGGRIAARLAVW